MPNKKMTFVHSFLGLAVVQSCSLTVLLSYSLAVDKLEEIRNFNLSQINRANMGTIRNFEELKIWTLARELVNLIYSDFRGGKDFVLRTKSPVPGSQ